MNTSQSSRSGSLLEKEYKIVVMGAGAVGKSSLTIRYLHQNFTGEYNPTLQEVFRKTDMIGNQPTNLEITDTAGQEDYIVMQDQWIREGKGFVLVYAINKEDSFEEVKNIKKRIDRVKSNPYVIVVGNKSDLEESRKIDRSQAEGFAQQQKALYIETSAKSGDNCNEVFHMLVKEMRAGEKPKTAQSQKKKGLFDSLFAGCTLI